jgi:hypothetical protein
MKNPRLSSQQVLRCLDLQCEVVTQVSHVQESQHRDQGRRIQPRQEEPALSVGLHHCQTTILKVLPYLYDVGYYQRIETETTIRQTGIPIPVLPAF